MISSILSSLWRKINPRNNTEYTDNPSRKRRRLSNEDLGLPPYEYKMPRLYQEWLDTEAANEAATSTPVATRYCKQPFTEMSQQRSGHTATLFEKNKGHRKENALAEDEVTILPGPSGGPGVHTGAVRRTREPLQAMQDDIQVVREVISPIRHSSLPIPAQVPTAPPVVSDWLQPLRAPSRRFYMDRKQPSLITRKSSLLGRTGFAGLVHKKSPRKVMGLQTCYQMEEKKKYSDMLKNYIKTSFCFSSSRHSSSPNASKIKSSWCGGKKVVQESIELVDLTLTEDVIEKTIATVEVNRSEECTPRTRALSKNEIEEEVLLLEQDSVPRKNSLADSLEKRTAFQQSWIPELSNSYRERQQQRQHELSKVKVRASLLDSKSKEEYDDKYMDKVVKQIQLFDIIKDEEEEEEEVLPELSQEAENLVDRAFIPRPPQEVLVSGFSKEITRKDISTLVGLNWLNDEVINFYMDLLMERGKLENYPSVYAFNTFFYPKLRQQGHASLKRWTKKVDIFSYEMLVVPVHLGMHWCLSIIDIVNKTVTYYDSMGGGDQGCLQALLKYLQDESMDKKKENYDTSKWEKVVAKDIPHQMNGSDCGMFSCMFAETLTRRARISFTQEHMPYFRRRMVYEILTKKIMT